LTEITYFRNDVAQEYGTHLFRMHTYSVRHEIIPGEKAVTRL